MRRTVLCSLALGCSGSPVGLPEPGGCDATEALEAVTRATVEYADVELAVADGFVPGPCEADAGGAAMGLHYTRVQASLDQIVDPMQPEVLLYVPDGDDLVLAGIEYVLPALLDGEVTFDPDSRPDGAWSAVPELFCTPFDGPMEGHTPLQPWHYDLHVWVHRDNPRGLFAQYNPDYACDEAIGS